MAKALRSPFPVCSSIRTYRFNQPGVGLNLPECLLPRQAKEESPFCLC